MKIKIDKIIIVSLAIFICCTYSTSAFAQKMTMSECMQKAVDNNKYLKASDYAIEIRKGEKKSMFGKFLPVVKTEANVLGWDDDLVMDLGIDLSGFSGMFGLFEELVGNPLVQSMLSKETLEQAAGLSTLKEELAGMDTSIKMRDNFTAQASVMVAQPLTQLYQVYSGYWANKELQYSAEKDYEAARNELELNVARAYIGLVTATQMKETAEAGLTQIDAYVKQVQAYLDAEIVERNALLKVQVKKADVQKSLYMTEKGIKIAKATLNLLMGRELNTPLEPVINESPIDPQKALDVRLKVQQRYAIEERPELLSARHKKEAARAGRHAAIGAMLPEISGIFKYEYSYGFGATQPENLYFGGLVLSWDAWEWGATYYKLKAAEAQQKQAEYLVEYANDGIRLDVETKRYELEESLKSLTVAEKQLEQVTENLRIEQIRYEVNETTTTDLLDAQTKELKARNEAIVARMKVRHAHYSLLSAMGRDLLVSIKDNK